MNQESMFSLPCEGPENIRVDLLKTFPYQGQRQRISYITHEFSAVCPFSGLPDLATIEIVYIPAEACLELKSLKLYLVSFRTIGMYQEHITNKLYQDIDSILKPEYLQIVTRYATRGGIDAVCEISSDAL
jgi:7-cyano-7-deazaguanine reductase